MTLEIMVAPVRQWHLIAYSTRLPRVRVGVKFGLGIGLGLGLGFRIKKERSRDFKCRVILSEP